MKPYYNHGGISIYHGDCREVLPSLPNTSLLFSDPPYGINLAGMWKPPGSPCVPDHSGDDASFDPAHLLPFPVVVLWGANNFANMLLPVDGSVGISGVRPG